MGIVIGKYEFEGPYSRLEAIKDIPGIYAVLSYDRGDFDLLELGEADCVRQAIENHERYDEWVRRTPGIVSAVCHYTPRHTPVRRQEMVNEIMREMG